MVGSSPNNYVVGKKYFFGVGKEGSKISPEEVEKSLTQAIEDHLFEKYGEPINLYKEEV